MDRSWIHLSDKLDPRFVEGVKEFLRFVKRKRPRKTTHPCPCRHCRLRHEKLCLDDIRTHLFVHGFMRDYTIWTSHGEEHVQDASTSLYTQRREYVSEKCREESDTYYMNNTMEDMLHDAFPFCQDPYDEELEDNDDLGKDAFAKYQRLLAEAQTPLYVGCPKTVLETILSAMKVKVENGWSDKSFDDHLRLTRELLPTPNHYPSSYREVKKLLKNMGMGYKVIHACEHGCMLYYKDFKKLDRCPMCNESRYHSDVGSKVPKKVVRYFPLKERLQRLYMSPHIAKEMRWHGERKIEDGLIRHPADCKAWQDFDNNFPEFSKEIRNIRLGLATDGFSPFGATTLGHSTWPIVVMPYNLPPSLCMKKEFNILAMLISARNLQGNA